MIHRVNFSPFATNVIDMIGADNLKTAGGLPVTISRGNYGFTITIGDQVYRTDDNLYASYILNMNDVGIDS